MVFTMFVNADRFQQGRYILSWCPYGGGKGNGQVPANWLDIHTRTLESRTALPHVELDVNSQTSVILKVPYNSAYTAFPISARTDSANQFGALGELQLWPYEPLVTAAGNNVAGYSVWCHLEDFELYGSAVPQSAPMDLTQQEQESSGVGPVSGPLMKVSKASSILAEFPLLSMYAQPVGWAAEIAARAAKVFGWSNPINLAPVTRVVNNVSYPYATNSDGIDNSMPLCMASDNKVSILPGFSGTDEDEMSVLSIASRPAHFSRFTMTEEQLTGTLLATIEVSPFADLNTFTQGGNNLIAMTPLNFAASMFQMWRGSIQYTFEIVKTEFHSGRIMVCFGPENFQTVAVPTTFATADYLYREMIDIRTCNSFTVTIPFVSLSPYKFVDPTLNSNFKTGGVFIYVVDQLVAPSTVSQSITFLVKHSAGPDFELAVPMPVMQLTPIGGVTAQSVPFRTSIPDPNTSEVVNIGNSSISGPTTEYAAASIGEKIVSFRAYLKRSCRIMVTGPGATAVDSILSFSPFATPCAFIATGTTYAPDYYSILSSMFLYSRGGVYIKVLTDAPDTVDHLHATVKLEPMAAGSWLTMPRVAVSGFSQYPGYADRGLAPFGGASILFKSKDAKNSDIEFYVPQYLPYINRLNSEAMFNPSMGYRTFTSATTSNMGVTIEFEDHNTSTIAAPPCYVSRSFADDGNFGCFVSVPVFAYNRIAFTTAV
nr:MAG: polyprotein 2 [Picornavirales sp.]